MKDLLSAFAENPKLPKMLRQKEILDTIDQGVRDGILVASLTRPDKSVRTWWRISIDEVARRDPAIEVFLPEKATPVDLHPSVLAPGILPGLWSGDAVSVPDVVAYFSGGRMVSLQREGYEEAVTIPACPRPAVEAAISEAVRQGTVWLLNGPASFQGEQIPNGVVTSGAQLSVALSQQIGHPLPWSALRGAIDAAIKSRWLELVPSDPAWPCDFSNAASVSGRPPGSAGEAVAV